MLYEIEPHHGIGPVKLGMSRAEVKVLFGSENYCNTNGEIDFYLESSLQIEFVDNKADFIGVFYCPDHTVSYKGMNVFDTEAKKLFEFIALGESCNHEYNTAEYLFPDQIISLWEADKQYDYIGSHKRLIRGQIGLGTQDYLKAINALIPG